MLGLLLTPLVAVRKTPHDGQAPRWLEYGALVAEHGRLLRHRWILYEPVANEDLLQAPEQGPVADTLALYDAVTGTGPVPIEPLPAMVAGLAPALLPMVAAAAVQVPIKGR